MLDFETLGVGPNKCVCQVGACYFDKSTGQIGQTLKINIDAASHQKYGARLDAATVYWWLAQSDQARQSILGNASESGGLTDVKVAFTQLNEFLKDAKRVWSHATFDFVTLMDTFTQLGIKPTVSYKAGLDLRTLVYLANVSTKKIQRDGVHHDALDDCFHQVKYAVWALNTIKTSRAAIKFLEGLKDE